MIFDFHFIWRHVVDGVFIGGEKVQVGQIFVVISSSVILEQKNISFLLNMDVPRVLSSPYCHDG